MLRAMHPQELPTASLPFLQVPQYDVTIRRFNDWLAGRPVTEQAVRDFFTDRMAAGYSARSIKLQKVAIKAGIRKAFPAHDTRITAALDTLFRSIRTPQPETRFQNSDMFTPQEIRALIAASPAHIALFVRALYNTGARISELLAIRLRDCRHGSRVVHCRITGKGKRERTLTVERTLFEAIQATLHSTDFLFEHNGKRYSRQHMGREIKKYCLRAIGRDIHPHALRHSRVTHLLAAGKPVEAVSKFVGHSRVETTLRFYAHNLLLIDDILEDGL